jgi:hypothetical protein
MKLTARAGRRLAAGVALACTGILLPAAALAAPAAPGTPQRRSAAPVRPTTASSWKIVKTVRGTNSPDFTAVTATGRHTAWAFESTSSKPVAWRLSRSRWTRAPFPGNVGETVTSAASTSPDDVWAAAYNGVAYNGARTQVLSWNGTSWAVTGSFPGSGGDLVPLSLNDAWFFDGRFHGGTGAWHYNGHRWSRAPKGNALVDGSALSPDSIWAIGATHVAHWNGHTWSRTSVASLLPTCKEHLCGPALSGINAQSPANVWAIGTGNRETIGGPVVVLHFNGHHWSRLALSDMSAYPDQVIPDGHGGLWIPLGQFERYPRGMLHYSGGHLRPAALPAVRGRLLDVQAVAAVPGVPRAIGVGETYWKNPIGAHQSAVILAYGS